MQKKMSIPGIKCDNCQNQLLLDIQIEKAKIKQLLMVCEACGFQEDLIEKSGEKLEDIKEQGKEWAKQVSKTLLKLKDTLPKNKDDWKQVVKNGKHPFTFALLTALAIFAMEMSGFAIFMYTTWILAHVILNPLGWILVPLIIGIVIAFRGHFKKDKLNKLKEKLDNLDAERKSGNMSDEEYDQRKTEIFSAYFS